MENSSILSHRSLNEVRDGRPILLEGHDLRAASVARAECQRPAGRGGLGGGLAFQFAWL